MQWEQPCIPKSDKGNNEWSWKDQIIYLDNVNSVLTRTFVPINLDPTQSYQKVINVLNHCSKLIPKNQIYKLKLVDSIAPIFWRITKNSQHTMPPYVQWYHIWMLRLKNFVDLLAKFYYPISNAGQSLACPIIDNNAIPSFDVTNLFRSVLLKNFPLFSDIEQTDHL